jgi:hypothetical protein
MQAIPLSDYPPNVVGNLYSNYTLTSFAVNKFLRVPINDWSTSRSPCISKGGSPTVGGFFSMQMDTHNDVAQKNDLTIEFSPFRHDLNVV